MLNPVTYRLNEIGQSIALPIQKGSVEMLLENNSEPRYLPIRNAKAVLIIYASIFWIGIATINYLCDFAQIELDFYPNIWINQSLRIIFITCFVYFLNTKVVIEYNKQVLADNMSKFFRKYYKRNIIGYSVEYFLDGDQNTCVYTYSNSDIDSNLIHRKDKYSIIVPISGWRKKYHIAKNGRTLDNAVTKVRGGSVNLYDLCMWPTVVITDFQGNSINIDVEKALHLFAISFSVLPKIQKDVLHIINVLRKNGESKEEIIGLLKEQLTHDKEIYNSLIEEKNEEIRKLERILTQREILIGETHEKILNSKRFVQSKAGAAIREWLEEEAGDLIAVSSLKSKLRA